MHIDIALGKGILAALLDAHQQSYQSVCVFLLQQLDCGGVGLVQGDGVDGFEYF